jgi:hypothetical protein
MDQKLIDEIGKLGVEVVRARHVAVEEFFCTDEEANALSKSELIEDKIKFKKLEDMKKVDGGYAKFSQSAGEGKDVFVVLPKGKQIKAFTGSSSTEIEEKISADTPDITREKENVETPIIARS